MELTTVPPIIPSSSSSGTMASWKFDFDLYPCPRWKVGVAGEPSAADFNRVAVPHNGDKLVDDAVFVHDVQVEGLDVYAYALIYAACKVVVY